MRKAIEEEIDLRGERNNKTWIPAGYYGNEPNHDIPFAEVFATHYENLIRSEHNLPLRKGYISDQSGSYMRPFIIDSKGRSLYFDVSGKTRYKIVNRSNRFIYK